MIKQFLTVFFALIVITSTAQSNSPITYTKGFGGYKFSSEGKFLTVKQLVDKYQDYPEAYKIMKEAQTNYNIGMALGYAGGFMVGWPLGTAIGGGEPNWTLAAIGAGILAIGIPISSGFNKKALKATDIYNEAISQKEAKLNLKMGVSPQGLGLVLRF